MQLDKLRILRTPGIRVPFTLAPRPGINLVTGPNGAGKSSVCRAVLSLLYPGLIDEEPFEAEAEFTLGAEHLRVSRRDREAPAWEGGSRPNLGPDHLASRYMLGVLDLLAPDSGKDPLAPEIRQHMAGGFDLAGLRESLFAARTGRSENADLKKAAENVTRLQREQQSLIFEQDRLKGLTAESELAKDARDRLAVLETLRSLIRETEAHDDAVSRLEDLPDACAAVRPEDPGQLNDLRKQERDHLKEIENRIAHLAANSRERDGLRNSGGLNSSLSLGLLKQKLGDLVELRRDFRQAEKEAGGAHQEDAAAAVGVKPSLIPALMLLIGGATLIAAGIFLPLSGALLPRTLILLGGVAAGAGFLSGVNYSRRAGQTRLAFEQESRIAMRKDHLARCRGQLNDALLDFNAALAVAGIDPVADIDEAAHLLEDLATRRDRLNVLEKEHQTHEEFLARERTDHTRVKGEIRVILERLGLENEPGADAEASRLLELVPRYDKAVRDRNAADREMERLSKRLTESAAHLHADESSAMSEAALTERIETEVTRAGDFGNLVKEIADIEARVEVTSKGHQLQEAMADAEGAAEALAATRQVNRESALGKLLLDKVERQHEKESRPLVLEQADAYFNLFTGRTYRLKMAAQGDGEDRFLAMAEDTVRPLELNELSDGTRAQLLLAVKLAFMTVAEEGVRPPIFLDDSLTSADPVRFAAVAKSLGELAATEDRQIFYLTPNPTDAAAIGRTLAEAGLPSAHHIDLARERDLVQMVDPSLLDPGLLPPRTLAPDPAGLSPAEFAAALTVPGPDPWAPRGMLHVYYVLDNHLDLVRRLVDGNAATIGRFAIGRDTLTAAGIITGDEAALTAAGAEVWGAWLDGWRLGRARPVPREFLKDSAAVSDKFMGSITSALEECGWDGAGLLQAIEEKKVKGFRANKLEELRQELDDAGLLAHGTPLTDDDLITHTRDRVAPLLAAKVLDMAKVRTLALTFARLVDPRETC